MQPALPDASISAPGPAGAGVNGVVATDLADWAAEINSEHLAALDCAETAIEHARRAGDLLIKAKHSLAHGEWLPWIAANIQIGERHVRNYMTLAKANRQRVADLSQRRALAELAAPKARIIADLRNIDSGTRIDGSPIPIETGRLSLGDINGEAACVLVESRRHRGFWHDINLRDGTASGRPMLPAGLQYFLALNPATASLEWQTAPDRGEFLELVS